MLGRAAACPDSQRRFLKVQKMRKIESEEDLRQVIDLRDKVRASATNHREFVLRTWPGCLSTAGAVGKQSASSKDRRRAWELWQLSLFDFTALRHQMRILNYYIPSRKAFSGFELNADLAKMRILTADHQALVAESPKPLGVLRTVRKQLKTEIETVDELRMERSYQLSQI